MKHETAKKLYWEYQALWDKWVKLGYYQLPKPRQKGWLMELRLRDDIMRSSEAGNYLLILPKIQDRTFSRTTVFEKVPVPQKLNSKNKEKYGFPDFFWKKYFHLVPGSESYWNGSTHTYPDAYKLNRPWVFEPIIRKNWITQVRAIDPDLARRMKEIENKITNQDLAPYLKKKFDYWFHYGRGRCRCDYCMDDVKQKCLMNQIGREIREELKYYYEISWE